METKTDGLRPEEEAKVAVVQTRRGPVEYAERGAGPAMLSLHGIMGGCDQSLLLARTVGIQDRRCIAVSRPGYLGTPLSSGRTFEEQADLCVELLDALGIERAAVIAVSGGGPCALHFALRHPKRCSAVLMFSACSGRLDDKLPLAWLVMKLFARWPWFAESMRRKALKDPEQSARRSISDPAVRARTLQDPEAGPLMLALQRSTMDRLAMRMDGAENDVAQTRAEMSLSLERIEAPLLAVHGTSDEIVPFAQSRELTARVPGAELLAVEGGEHVSIFTHRDAVVQRVASFLAARAPAGSNASR